MNLNDVNVNRWCVFSCLVVATSCQAIAVDASVGDPVGNMGIFLPGPAPEIELASTKQRSYIVSQNMGMVLLMQLDFAWSGQDTGLESSKHDLKF